MCFTFRKEATRPRVKLRFENSLCFACYRLSVIVRRSCGAIGRFRENYLTRLDVPLLCRYLPSSRAFFFFLRFIDRSFSLFPSFFFFERSMIRKENYHTFYEKNLYSPRTKESNFIPRSFDSSFLIQLKRESRKFNPKSFAFPPLFSPLNQPYRGPHSPNSPRNLEKRFSLLFS